MPARLLKAKQAHDELISAAYRAQGDALLIESQAKIRLADEIDAAQRRKQVHEARQIRDAEAADPGIIRRTIDERVTARQEPTKAAIREAVRSEVARPREPLWTPADRTATPIIPCQP